MLDILTVAFATACVVQTVHASFLFEGFRQRVIKLGENPGWKRELAKGIMCAYCLSHWIALPASFVVFPFEYSSIVKYFAAVWLASHSTVVYLSLNNLFPFLKELVVIKKGGN